MKWRKEYVCIRLFLENNDKFNGRLYGSKKCFEFLNKSD